MALADFSQMLENSTYLQQLQIKYPELSFCEAQPLTLLRELILSLTCGSGISERSSEQVEEILICAKAKFSWYWALAELRQDGSFAERGQLQTEFAEASLNLALGAAWLSIAHKQPNLARVAEKNPINLPGIFILGLGKLGGKDLNYSSDIDLIAYFDPQVLPIPEVLGQSYVCHQVVQKVTKMLSQNGRADFIWRVDWRLRPNASATTLAMSTNAAEAYYFYHASPWHRLALMKARVVAGDLRLGQQFLKTLKPFVWRQNLDYRALDELGEIKRKIKREHPSLRHERAWQEPINHEIAGYNVKLGSGGIREIEFVANALQLVWGGKNPALRTSNTLDALAELAKLNLLASNTVSGLIGAYQFLRRLENGLQIMGNQQTHLIPSDEDQQRALIELLQFPNQGELVAALTRHRIVVSAQFNRLFEEQSSTISKSIVWPSKLTDVGEEITRNWENGFIGYGVSREMRSRLRPLTLELSEALAEVENPSTTALRLHSYFQALPKGEQYFRLLSESPALLRCVIGPLMHSPAMSTLLKQSPHIIDCFLHSDRQNLAEVEAGNYHFDTSFVMDASTYEIRLERMRRCVNEQLYQLYLGFLQGQLGPNRFQSALTVLAEHAIELALKVVADEMKLAGIPVTVIGLGKMGVAKMAPQSDVDLIFVYDSQRFDLTTATSFVARLQTAIATPMQEGVVYELDTRLRPSGRSGAPTVSIESFRKHQLTRAHTWEHIALVSARVVADAPGLGASIMDVKREVISRTRNPAQFLQDAQTMWVRIREHRISPLSADIFGSKLRSGGLMQAEYLAAGQILAPQHNKTKAATIDDFYSLLAATDADFPMGPAIAFWQAVQLWERLLGLDSKPIKSTPQAYREYLCMHTGCENLTQLEDKQQEAQCSVAEGAENFFRELRADFDPNEWQETAVDWLD